MVPHSANCCSSFGQLISTLLSTRLLWWLRGTLQFALSSQLVSGGYFERKELSSTRIKQMLNPVAGGYNSCTLKLPKMPTLNWMYPSQYCKAPILCVWLTRANSICSESCPSHTIRSTLRLWLLLSQLTYKQGSKLISCLWPLHCLSQYTYWRPYWEKEKRWFPTTLLPMRQVSC